MLFGMTPQQLIISVIVVVFCIMIHEIAHAATALAFGDASQKDRGRLSLNPLRHIDPLGFIMLVIVGFGWAKPVIFETAQLKHRNIAVVLVALAGPFSNLLMAVVGFIGLKGMVSAGDFFQGIPMNFIISFISINLGLFLFNLLPIPPLDGSHLVNEAFFRDRPDLILRFNQIGSLALMAIFLLQAVSNVTILPFGDWIRRLFTLGLQVFGLA